jgi:hypothetical protein
LTDLKAFNETPPKVPIHVAAPVKELRRIAKATALAQRDVLAMIEPDLYEWHRRQCAPRRIAKHILC